MHHQVMKEPPVARYLRQALKACPAPKIAERPLETNDLRSNQAIFMLLRASQSDMTTDTKPAALAVLNVETPETPSGFRT